MYSTHGQDNGKGHSLQVDYHVFFSARSLHTSDLFRYFRDDTPQEMFDGLWSQLVEACCAARLPCELAACSVVFEQAMACCANKNLYSRQRLACVFWLERNTRNLRCSR